MKKITFTLTTSEEKPQKSFKIRANTAGRPKSKSLYCFYCFIWSFYGSKDYVWHVTIYSICDADLHVCRILKDNVSILLNETPDGL